MESLGNLGRSVYFGRGYTEPEQPEVMPPPASLPEEPLPSKDITYGFDDESDHGNDLENGVDDDVEPEPEPITNTVVSLADIEDSIGDAEESEDDDEDIPTASGAPVAPMEVEAPATAKKRGRPSLSASASGTGTPAMKGRTPGRNPAPTATPSAKTPSTNGIKRKAADKPADPAPPSAKRARAGARAPSARKSAMAATIKTAAAGKRKAASGPKTPKVPGKRGRPAKIDDADTYNVEKIVEDAIDADTMEHKFLIKWEGYPDSDNSWEPKSNLNCPDLIAAFEKEKKKAAAADKPPRAPRGSKTPKALKVPKSPKVARVVKKAAGTGKKRGRPAKTKA